MNLVGTLVEPTDLKRLAVFRGLRELLLPGPQWNPGAGSKLDANEEFKEIASLIRDDKDEAEITNLMVGRYGKLTPEQWQAIIALIIQVLPMILAIFGL